MSSALAALSELQQLTAVLEAEKKAAAALQKTLDDRESVVTAAQKQVVALRAEVEAESKARVQLQIDMGEFEAKLKGLVTFMQRVQQKEKDDKASAMAAADAKNAADGKAPDPKAVVPKYGKRTAATMAPEQIVEACVTAFQRLRRTRGESLTDGDHKLMASIRATPVEEYATPGARLLVGQYLAGVAALAVNAATSEAEALKHLKAQANDSRLLYHMFSIPANSAELTEGERFEAECMRMDVATRLQNGPVLSELFNAMIKRTLQKLPPPLLVPMMTAAAQLGEWAALRDLGKHLESKGENLRQLHDVALQQRGMPDLEQLYALSVVDGKARETPKPEGLKWAEYTITSSILKLKKIDSPDPEAAAAITNDFKEYPEGKELCSPDAVHRLLRCGAHAIYIAPEANAMPVTGPADDKTMHLHGWMEMKNGAGAGDITGRAQAADGGTTRQEETYVLQFKSADPKARTQIWSGEYSMVNNVTDPSGPGLQLKCVFEATIVLEEVERDS